MTRRSQVLPSRGTEVPARQRPHFSTRHGTSHARPTHPPTEYTLTTHQHISTPPAGRFLFPEHLSAFSLPTPHTVTTQTHCSTSPHHHETTCKPLLCHTSLVCIQLPTPLPHTYSLQYAWQTGYSARRPPTGTSLPRQGINPCNFAGYTYIVHAALFDPGYESIEIRLKNE